MDSCQYYPVENSCKCFHQTELRQVSIIFRDTANCNGIQNKLRDLVYGMSGVYSGGLVTCILAVVMETLLLCRKRSSKVREVDCILLHECRVWRRLLNSPSSVNNLGQIIGPTVEETSLRKHWFPEHVLNVSRLTHTGNICCPGKHLSFRTLYWHSRNGLFSDNYLKYNSRNHNRKYNIKKKTWH